MFYYVSIDWYGMFIISVPVWAFLVVPFAITFGAREAEGSVLSIGAIDLGLFFLVYCVGHIGYLMFHSVWTAVYVVTAVALCDLFDYVLNSRDRRAPDGQDGQTGLLGHLVPGPSSDRTTFCRLKTRHEGQGFREFWEWRWTFRRSGYTKRERRNVYQTNL